jgi:hypothetical protein
MRSISAFMGQKLDFSKNHIWSKLKKKFFSKKIENFINLTVPSTKNYFFRYRVADFIEKNFFIDLEMSKFNFFFQNSQN